MSLPSRQQQRIDRASLRRSVSATAKITEPPGAAVVKKQPKRPKPPEAKRCGLLVINNDGSNASAYRAPAATGAWTTILRGDLSVAINNQIINKGGRVSYPGDSFFISADKGQTWTTRALPTGSSFFNGHDRSPSGRYWTASFDDGLVYYSDDEMASWSSSGSAFDFSNIYQVSAHPGDSNRIVVTHDNLDVDTLQVTVTTDGGDSWSQHDVVGYGAGGWVLWLSTGRMVAIGFDNSRNFYSSYSDDDGVTWSTPSTLVSAPAGNRLALTDYRAIRTGAMFVLLDELGGTIGPATSRSSYKTLRSVNGADWDTLDPVDSTEAVALAYCEQTFQLFILHRGGGIFRIPGARTLAVANWAASASALSNAPSDAYAAVVGNLDLTGYMCAI